MNVPRSGYYKWKEGYESLRLKEYNILIPIVRQIHINAKGVYGARRIAKELRAKGFTCGRMKARTLMRLAGVTVRTKRKFKATTNSKHTLNVSPNLLKRDFSVSEPDRVYVSDITYLWTDEGWLYLAVVIDLFSRQVVGWSLDKRMTKKLVVDALSMAIWRRQPKPGAIFHSDRGSQYCSNDFRRFLRKYKMQSSMSRKGNCWDNAVAESFFGSLKTERVFFERYQTRSAAMTYAENSGHQIRCHL